MLKKDLRQAFARFLVIGLLAISPFSAADSGDSLKRLYEMRLLTFGILSDYYMFSGLEGDTRYNRDIESSIKRFESHLAALTSDGKQVAKLSSLTTAIDHWHKFRKLLDTNRSDFLVRGYADARLVTDLGNLSITLSNSLGAVYDDLEVGSGYKLSEWTQICRRLGLIIQTITAEYSARATSSLGQVMIVEINEGGMAKQAEVFDGMLKKLNSAPDQSKLVSKTLDQIGVKWVFIAKSIQNYNTQAVPFIINTYGERIAQNLDEIGAYYQTSLQAKK